MRDPDAPRARWCLLLAGLCALLLAAVYLVAVRTAWGQRAGDAAIAGGLDRAPDVIAASAALLGVASLPRLAAATLLLTAVGAWRGGWPLAAGVAALVGGANVTTQVLKRAVLDRPTLLDHGDPFGAHNSLPSGHATLALSLALAVALLAPARWRMAVAVPCLLLAVLFGVATVTAGWHRPSDVMAADLVVVGWASLVAAALLWHGEARGRPAQFDAALAAARLPVWERAHRAATLLLALALPVWLTAVLDPDWNRFDSARFTVAYAGGIGVLAAAGALLGSSFLAAVAGVDFGPKAAPRPGRAGDGAG